MARDSKKAGTSAPRRTTSRTPSPETKTPAGRGGEPSRPGNGSRRREELLGIAAEIFAEKGVVATTTRDIARRADILSGSLYHHFESKEAMVDEIIRTYWDALFETYDDILAGDDAPVEKLSKLLRSSIELGITHRDRVLILHNDWHYLTAFLPYVDKNMTRVAEIWIDVLNEGVRTGGLRADLDVWIAYRALMGAITWVPRWYNPKGRRSLEAIADAELELFLQGLLPR